MSPAAEFFLETDRSLAVGAIDVATGRDVSPNVHVDPETASLTAGGGDPATGGEIRVRNPSNSANVGVLSAKTGAGRLTLSDRSGEPSVTLDAESTNPRKVEISDGDDVTGIIENTAEGGLFAVRDGRRDDHVVVGEATHEGGKVTLLDGNASETCELLGGDGALLLSGTPERDTETDGSTQDPAYGGGELVIQNYTPGPRDIHVHATAERDSDYGVDDNHNRPRIFLNGPDATLELGREELDSEREAVNGEIIVRDDRGNALLELRATTGGRSEMVFRFDDNGTVKPRGKIKAHPDGLMLYDAGDKPAMLIQTTGEIKTRKGFTDDL